MTQAARKTDPVRCWPLSGLLKSRFRQDEDGAAAIEFALVASPFIGMIFAILSIAHYFWIGATLQDAVQEAGRQIRVGKVEAAGLSKNDFKAFICTYLAIPKSNCLDGIVVDVESASSIAGLSNSDPDPDNEKYDPGEGADYVLVRAKLPITSFNSLFKLFGTKTSPSFTLTSVTAFRNEPFN